MRVDLSVRATAWAFVMSGLLALGACGGGGGGDSPPSLVSPPTTAASLSASTAEAASAAQGAVDAAAEAVELYATLGNGPVPITGAGGAMSRSLFARSLREQAQARETVGCADFLGIADCTGTVTIDTNLSDSGTVAAPGTYITIIFNALRATVDGDTLALDGVMRVEFLTSFDLNSTSFANQRMELTLQDFAGSAGGVSFGPYDVHALIEYDANEVSTVTIDGVRIEGLENIVVTDGLNYGLTNVALRRAVWSSATAYVDYDFDQWSVTAGRPALGSAATLSAGANSIAVAVTASSSAQVVYAVTITIGGASTAYTVTATYPAGGGAPTYAAVPAGG